MEATYPRPFLAHMGWRNAKYKNWISPRKDFAMFKTSLSIALGGDPCGVLNNVFLEKGAKLLSGGLQILRSVTFYLYYLLKKRKPSVMFLF